MGKCDADSGVLFSACLPACLPVSPSLCGQMPDAVTPAPGSVSQSPRSDARCCDATPWLRVVSPAPCVSQSLRSDARRSWGGVSRLSPCVFQCQMLSLTAGSCLLPLAPCLPQTPDAVTLAPGRVSRLFSVSPRLSPCVTVGCQML